MMNDHTDLIQLRHTIHREPDLSGHEQKTADRIAEELAQTSPDELIRDIGGTGIAAIFEGQNEGLTIMLRAELDALPIPESDKLPYSSQVPGVSHKCGHDGHMAALVGLARRISKSRNQLSGRIVLLFQPAEEVATGAVAVVADPHFDQFHLDRVFAWHNLPGFPIGSVIVRNGVFASASRGLVVRLRGKTSHAAHTEDGVSPLPVVTHLLSELPRLPQDCVRFDHAARVTVIHAWLGEIAFGTSPGEAEVMATFRTHHEQDMARMVNRAESMIIPIAKAHGLEVEIEWRDEFPATVNDDTCVACVRHAADAVRADIVEAATAFPWSEDFGVFTEKVPGALFGIGSGTNQPQLHHPDYDFPDELLNHSIDVMWELVKDVSGSSSCR
jgi:amidohydrolase